MSRKPPDPTDTVRVFVSSSREPKAVRLRKFLKNLEDSINPQLRKFGSQIDVELWENELPLDAAGGYPNQRNVELAKGCHFLCVLLFDWVGPGTAQEVRAALELPKLERPSVSIFRFRGGEQSRPSDDAVKTQDFLEEHKNDLDWSVEIDADTDDPFVKLTQPIFAAALKGASHRGAGEGAADVY